MDKIVVDTNIFISTLFSNRGASFRLVERLIEEFEKGNRLNCVSVPSIMELEEVIFREKNRKKYSHFSSEDLKLFIDDIVYISNRVKLNYLWRPFLKDSGDDKILETAFNSGAKYIITYNIQDFDGVFENFKIKIIKPKEYLLGVLK